MHALRRIAELPAGQGQQEKKHQEGQGEETLCHGSNSDTSDSEEPALVEAYRQIGICVGRLLAGAKALGLDVPPTLLARAEDVIE